MSKVYVPNYNDFSCVVVKDKDTIRAYKSQPNNIIYDNLYQKVDYLLSTSKEAFIDSGLKFDKNYRIEIVGNTDVNSSAMFFDSYINNTNRVGNVVYNKLNPRIDFWFNNVSYSALSTNNIDLSKKFVLIQDDSSISIEQNSYRNVINYQGNILQNGANILFFRSQRDLLYEYTKVYSIKIYFNNNIIRNYVPVYNINTKKGGLYDTINKTFYASNGTSEFEYDNNSNYVEYVDFYINSHYLQKTGIESIQSEINCLSVSDLTSNIYYRNDLLDVSLISFIFILIIIGIPYKLLKTFRKSLR